ITSLLSNSLLSAFFSGGFEMGSNNKIMEMPTLDFEGLRLRVMNINLAFTDNPPHCKKITLNIQASMFDGSLN
ncbi:MAG: hypothetical protein KDD62_12325, partial [Bdellovibrionales bacterium]|nr:hypothetical protein [Bdellovibrionales bacterium]